LGDGVNEPATTLTDYLLAAECAAFAIALARVRAPSLVRSAFVTLFASASLAALVGGTVHGFFPQDGAASRSLWLITLLSIGVTAAAMLTLAARLVLDSAPARDIVVAAALLWLAYAGIVLFISRDFVVAIAAYLPAALVLMIVLARDWLRDRGAGAAAGMGGVLLALLGAAGQQAGLGVHPQHFDHNAVYHVVQMAALYLLFRCAMASSAASAGVLPAAR
jgi:hypothetical protein